MKKTTLILAGIALIAASCAKTEVVSSGALSSQKGIGFSAYTARPTKAAQTDVTTNDFNSFEVTAIGNGAVYFDNVTFSKNSEGVWASTPLYFWPAYKLDFYAYNTPTQGNGTFTRNITTTAPQTLTYSPAEDLSQQEDLVAASVTAQTESNNNNKNAIALTFNHYLTQVVVKAMCSNSNYKVEVAGVKIAHMKDELVYNFSLKTAVPTNDASDKTYSSILTSAKTLDDEAQDVIKCYLVPQGVTSWKRVPTEPDESGNNDMKNTLHGTYLALKVKITSNNNTNMVYPISGDYAWMAVPVPTSLAFAQGKKYNVTFDFFSTTGGGAGYVDPEDPGELDGDSGTKDNGKKIIGGAIKFDATVSEWGDAVDVTISL